MIGLIGLSIVAFLVSDASRMGGSLFRDNGTTIGIVGGEKISEAEFNTKLQLQVVWTVKPATSDDGLCQ